MVKFKANNAGYEALRRKPETQQAVMSAADRLAAEAGRGFISSGRQGRKGPAPKWNAKRGPGYQGRYRAIVFARSYSAMTRQRRDNRLQKALFTLGR